MEEGGAVAASHAEVTARLPQAVSTLLDGRVARLQRQDRIEPCLVQRSVRSKIEHVALADDETGRGCFEFVELSAGPSPAAASPKVRSDADAHSRARRQGLLHARRRCERA